MAEILKDVAGVEGYLTSGEIKFLCLLAAVPTCAGEILEIGSFRGRSAIVLSKAAALAGSPRVVAVDHLIWAPDSHAGRQATPREQFEANLARAGVDRHIEFHQEPSAELARKWDASRRLRLLWIDGDHSYAGAKTDFDGFRPFLADGAIVALHDVLHHCDGPNRVLAEDMLLSPHFGPAGVCGSIGWAQYFEDTSRLPDYRDHKLALYRGLQRLVPHVAFGFSGSWWAKTAFKFARARVPHRELTPEQWIDRLCWDKRAST